MHSIPVVPDEELVLCLSYSEVDIASVPADGISDAVLVGGSA
jgi:hypothetical protein